MAHDPPDVTWPGPPPGDTPHPPGTDDPDELDPFEDEPDDDLSDDDVLFAPVDEVCVVACAAAAKASVPATLATASPPVTTAALRSPSSRVGMSLLS
jgi:hypothetical protein